MANLNTLPIAPSEPRSEDPIFAILATYAYTGTDDSWLQSQAAIQSLQSLQSAQNVFSVLESIYRGAQTAVPRVSETTLERQRAILEALQSRASHLQAREQQKQFVAQRVRDNDEEDAEVSDQREVQGTRLQTLRTGRESSGIESALLVAADQYDLDRASALIETVDSVNALNRTFEASVIVLETSDNVAQQRSHALLQELLRQRIRKLNDQQQQQQRKAEEARQTEQNNLSANQATVRAAEKDSTEQNEQQQQELVRDVLQNQIAKASNNSTDEESTITGNEIVSWSESLTRVPCWIVFLGGVVILSLFVALVSFISSVVSRNRAIKTQKEFLLQQQQQQQRQQRWQSNRFE